MEALGRARINDDIARQEFANMPQLRPSASPAVSVDVSEPEIDFNGLPKFVPAKFREGLTDAEMAALREVELHRRTEFDKFTAEYERAEKAVDEAKKSRIDTSLRKPRKDKSGRTVFHSRKARDKFVDDQSAELQRVLARITLAATDPSSELPRFNNKVAVGSVCFGSISRRFRVAQVVADGEILAKFPAGPNSQPMLVWIEGADTATITDNTEMKIVQPLMFTGTRMYQNTGGSNSTVFVARLFNIREYLKPE